MCVYIYLFELLVDLQCCEDWFQWSFSPALLITTPVLSSGNDLGEDSLRPSQLLGLQAETWNGLDCSATDRPPSFAVGEGLPPQGPTPRLLNGAGVSPPAGPEASRALSLACGLGGVYLQSAPSSPAGSPGGRPERLGLVVAPLCGKLSPSRSELGGAGVRWGRFSSAVPSREGRWDALPAGRSEGP